MELMRLPSEILYRIVDYLGSSYFQEDPSRLCVCRQWFFLVQNIRFEHFRLSQSQLQKLLSSPSLQNYTSLIQGSLRSFELDLVGYDGWDPEEDYPSDYNEDKKILLKDWTVKLNENVTKIANYIKQSTKLRAIRIHAPDERHQFIWFRHSYLQISTVRGFLTLKNLSVLELDLYGTFRSEQDGTLDQTHLCDNISALFSTLKCLRLRLANICPRALELPQGTRSTKLEKVLVNITHAKIDTLGGHGVTYCNICRGSVGFNQLKTMIEEQARLLATQMAFPKSVRVLQVALMYDSGRYSDSDLKIKSFNALTGERTILAIDADWDEDGDSEKMDDA